MYLKVKSFLVLVQIANWLYTNVFNTKTVQNYQNSNKLSNIEREIGPFGQKLKKYIPGTRFWKDLERDELHLLYF